MAIDRRVTIETISRYWRSTTWTDLNGPLRVTARHCVCVCMGEGGGICVHPPRCAICLRRNCYASRIRFARRTNGCLAWNLAKGKRKRGQRGDAGCVLQEWESLFRLNIGIDSIEGKEMRESCKGEYSEWNCIIGYFVLCWNSYWDLKRNCEKRYWKRILLGECGEWLEKIVSIILHVGTIQVSYFIYFNVIFKRFFYFILELFKCYVLCTKDFD